MKRIASAPNRSALRRSIAILVLVTTTAQGCTTWVRVAPDREDALDGQTIALRVTTRDSVVRTVYSPRFTSDSLIASRLFVAPRTPIPTGSTVTIARADIQDMHVQRASYGKTVLLLAGMAGVLFAIVAAGMSSTDLSTSGGCGLCISVQ